MIQLLRDKSLTAGRSLRNRQFRDGKFADLRNDTAQVVEFVRPRISFPRATSETPRIGLIGAGKFGSMFLVRMPHMAISWH
jgi:hypothetical protein